MVAALDSDSCAESHTHTHWHALVATDNAVGTAAARAGGAVGGDASSAFAGVLLRMMETSGTTLAEVIDTLPSAVWFQSAKRQTVLTGDGLGDDARRFYVTQ